MALVPPLFLFRLAYRCPYVKGMPFEDRDELLDLPAAGRIDPLADLASGPIFADVALGWNELGLGFQAVIRGKREAPVGDVKNPRGSDGATLWIDTRDARTSHRASRTCHQFSLLPTGSGPDGDEPILIPAKIHRALHDAPLSAASAIPFRCERLKNGYRLEAFFPALTLNGYDPEQNPRLGFYYAIHDAELGDQVLTVNADFPYWEDPSLWSTLELVK